MPTRGSQAQVARWGARGVAALSVPLLLVLLLKEQWTAATALAAAMVLVPALLGRRLWRWVGVPSLAGVPAGFPGATGQSFVDEAELVRYSAAVLDAYLRRTGAQADRRDISALVDRTGENGSVNGKGDASRKGNGRASKANGSGDANGVGDAGRWGRASVRAGTAMPRRSVSVRCPRRRRQRFSASIATPPEAEIRAAHGQISAAVDPAHGGSPYLAIKVDHAKEVLVRAASARSTNAPSKAPRKRSAPRRRPSPPA